MEWENLTRVAELSFYESNDWSELRVWARDTDAALFWAIDYGGSCAQPFEFSPGDYDLEPLLDLGWFAVETRKWARSHSEGSVADRIAKVNKVVERVVDCLDGSYLLLVAAAEERLAKARAEVTRAETLVKEASLAASRARDERNKAQAALRDLTDSL